MQKLKDYFNNVISYNEPFDKLGYKLREIDNTRLIFNHLGTWDNFLCDAQKWIRLDDVKIDKITRKVKHMSEFTNEPISCNINVLEWKLIIRNNVIYHESW